MVFLDTNILLYSGSQAKDDLKKREIASRLILEQDIALSSQVVQEYISNALRKPALGSSPPFEGQNSGWASQIQLLFLNQQVSAKSVPSAVVFICFGFCQPRTARTPRTHAEGMLESSSER